MPSEYGVVAVDVTRGGSTATWAVYSTALGSPVVDTTGGTFRFTCDGAQAPCFVAVKAAGSLGQRWHGVLLSAPPDREDRVRHQATSSPPSTASTPTAPTAPPPRPDQAAQGSHPDYEALDVNIGGTADCLPGSPAGGDVARIEVPAGFYNVDASFSFRK